jgi:hypothetical protein
MRNHLLALLGLDLLVVLCGCSVFQHLPTPSPTLLTIPSPTLSYPTPSNPVQPPVEQTSTGIPQETTPIVGGTPTQMTSEILPGTSIGPYAVILVAEEDVLNIRTGAGAGYANNGSFASTAVNIYRSGPAITTGGVQWVQVHNPDSGVGWVIARYLTEYVPPDAFCADVRVNTLLADFGNYLLSSDGEALAAQVSPEHGLAVSLWRFSAPIVFDQAHARWVFDSTYVHNWGAAPASGMDTIGSFHEAVLPWLREVFTASTTSTCNSVGTATQFGDHTWPVEYTNYNFYTLYKPGTPGVELDFRYLLVGVEFVQAQPYLSAVIHFTWEP